jgi:PAS domain S-box-containing protein
MLTVGDDSTPKSPVAPLRSRIRGSRLSEPAAGADRNQGMDASRATHEDQRATVTVDRDGIIHQWGDAVTELTGHSADESLGRSLNFIVPPVLRPLHWWGFNRAMRRGRLSHSGYKVPALRDDGRIVVAHTTFELIPGKGGGIDSAVVTFTGVGAPWQGMAWRAALAPFNLAHRILQRVRSHR